MTKIKENQPLVAHYNQTAHQMLMGMINLNANRFNRVIEIWDKMETGSLGPEHLPFLISNDSDYFKKIYLDRVWDMIDALKIPSTTKQKLLEESISSHLEELIQLLDNARLSSRGNMIPIGGGFRNFEMQPEYFEFQEEKVIPASDAHAKTRGLFEVAADSPDKAKALELFEEIAQKMTLFSSLLESSGLYPAIDNPIFDRSNLFSYEKGEYKPRVEALL